MLSLPSQARKTSLLEILKKYWVMLKSKPMMPISTNFLRQLKENLFTNLLQMVLSRLDLLGQHQLHQQDQLPKLTPKRMLPSKNQRRRKRKRNNKSQLKRMMILWLEGSLIDLIGNSYTFLYVRKYSFHQFSCCFMFINKNCRQTQIRASVIYYQNSRYMKQPYFCPNCKQYHVSCTKDMTKTNSVQFLRFSDLFSYTPHAHPQNFNVNSPRKSENAKLVYDNEESRRIRFNKHHSIVKISSEQNSIGQRDQQSPHNKNNFYLKKKQKPNTEQTQAKKKDWLLRIQDTRHKTQQKEITNLEQFKNKTKNTRKQVTVHMQFTDKKNPKPPIGPYYIVTKLNTNSNVSEKQRETDSKVSQLKKSYIYGDQGRQILTPPSKVEQFKIDNRSQQKIMTENKVGNVNANISGREYKNQLFGSRVKYATNTKMTGNLESERGQLDYANKLSELKQMLKANEKNYKEKNSQITKQPQSVNKPLSVTENATKQNCYILQTKPKVHLKIFNKLLEHQFKSGLNKICCPQNQQCKYFDNRCLGFSLFDQGEVNFIADSGDLL